MGSVFILCNATDNCSDNITSVWSSIVSFPLQNVHCLFNAKVLRSPLASGFVTPVFCISDNETLVTWRFTPFHNIF